MVICFEKRYMRAKTSEKEDFRREKDMNIQFTKELLTRSFTHLSLFSSV
jgi:hypothetical protein